MGKEKAKSNLFNDTWNFFSSLKLTVVLLLLLAATSIIGTLVPQNEEPAKYYQAFGEVWYRILHVLDVFDMYHAWWFQLLLLLLTANVIVCSIDRLSATWKIVFTRTPSFKASRFRQLNQKEEFFSDHSQEKLAAMLTPVLAGAFSRSLIENEGKHTLIFAEKGRWTRLGVYIVHLSVVLLLLGGLIGSIYGYEGFVSIPEGQSVRRIHDRNSHADIALDFEIRCDRFDVTFYDSGMPREYRSGLTLLENGRPVLQKDILVNHPLRYRGINIFQSSYGVAGPKEVTVNFESLESGMNYQRTTRLGETIDIPEGLGRFSLKNFTRSYSFRGQDIGEAFLGTILQENKAPLEIIVPVRFAGFDKMRKGSVAVSIQNYTPLYYTGLQVTRDPGVWVVYAGFILLIAGCFVTFFMAHQQVCVEIAPDNGKNRITITGFSNKNKLGWQKDLARLSQKLHDLTRANPVQSIEESP